MQLAADDRLDHAQHAALEVGAQHIRTEFVANPPFIAHHLQGLGIEIDAREVTARGCFRFGCEKARACSGRSERVVRGARPGPLPQSAESRCTISSASCELTLLPKPLSVNARNSPLPRDTMPEKPCTDWPRMGSEPPEARGYLGSPTKVLALSLPSCSLRWRLALANLPAVAKKAPASRGAATEVSAARAAWPASVASTAGAVWARPLPAARHSAQAARQGQCVHLAQDLLVFAHPEIPLAGESLDCAGRV